MSDLQRPKIWLNSTLGSPTLVLGIQGVLAVHIAGEGSGLREQEAMAAGSDNPKGLNGL
jgi:hypothetical protein